MPRSRRAGSLLVLILVVGGILAARSGVFCGEKAGGLLALRPDRDDVLVHVDGRLMGTAHRDRPLEMRLAVGARDLRLSSRGSPDLFGRITVEAGTRLDVEAVFPALEAPPVAPENPQPIGLGQTLRLALPRAGSDDHRPWRLRLPGEQGERVLLVVSGSGGPVTIAVHDELTGEVLTPRRLEGKDVEGLDGDVFLEFRHSSAGAVIIVPTSAAGTPVNPVVLRVCRAPPPLVAIAGTVGRRSPPPEMGR